MLSVTVQRNLIGLEDLLTGVGAVEQTRGTSTIEITKINGSNLPYDADLTMAEKIAELQAAIDAAPQVIDEDGDYLVGSINSSSTDLNLANRLWRKTIDANEAHIYYGTELIVAYDPATGGIILPEDTDYIAADAVVTAAYIAADTVIAGTVTTLDSAVSAFKGKSIGTSANNVVALNGSAQLPAVSGALLTNLPTTGHAPIGAVVDWLNATPPTNWLECDGSAISRTTYSDLFALLSTTFGAGDGSTTFNLPDFRGEFIRGWDNGKGTDTGRTLGSYQADSIKAHTHDAGTLATASSGSHSHSLTHITGVNTGSGSLKGPSTNIGDTAETTTSAGAHTHTISGATASSGSTETRPRNISAMKIIRAL